jgi:dipeptidase
MQSTGSLVAHLGTERPTFWVTGTSAPCTGIFKPVWFGSDPLPEIGPAPGGTYHPDTLWWYHERLHRNVLLDYANRLSVYREERDALETGFLEKAGSAGPDQQAALTAEAFACAREATERWTEQVRALPIKRRARRYYRRFWKRRNRKAQIEV